MSAISGYANLAQIQQHIAALDVERGKANRLGDLEGVEAIDEQITVYTRAAKEAGGGDEAAAIVTHIMELLDAIPGYGPQRRDIAALVDELATLARKPKRGR